MPSLALLLTLLLSYLLGAIPFAVVVVKYLHGIDVQRVGSGNAGALNTSRVAGRSVGVLVAVLDGLKGALAMLIGRLIFGPQVAALCGVAAVVGHCFSPYLLYAARKDYGAGWKMLLRRSGGKGLATGGVVIALIDWRLLVIVLVVFALSKLILRTDVTWPTIIAVAVTAPLIWWLTGNLLITLAVLLVAVVVIVKHLPDVRRGFYVEELT